MMSWERTECNAFSQTLGISIGLMLNCFPFSLHSHIVIVLHGSTLHLWKHLHELIEKKGSRIRSKGKMNQTKDNMCNWHYQDVIGGVLFVLPSQTLATSFIQTVSCCFFKIPHDNRWPEAMSASVCESSVMSRQIVFKSGLLLPDSTGQRCFLPTSNRCTIPMNLFFLLRFTLQKLHSSVNEGYYLVCK